MVDRRNKKKSLLQPDSQASSQQVVELLAASVALKVQEAQFQINMAVG